MGYLGGEKMDIDVLAVPRLYAFAPYRVG